MMDDTLERIEADALRMMTYGAYVVGAAHEGEVAAATVAWATQASLTSPPMVVVCLRKRSHTHALALQSERFSVNMLSADQVDLAREFLHPTTTGQGRLNGHRYRVERTGAPILEEAPAWIELELRHVADANDHDVCIGAVVHAGVAATLDGHPLTLRDMGLRYAGMRGAYATGKSDSAWPH
jgi:flavin reductase (DIM6/NTAB) family NADH-FMN oxidoreductase RutF